jgi:hypothetical protein
MTDEELKDKLLQKTYGRASGKEFYRNPEGPQAVVLIEELEAEIEKLETANERLHTALDVIEGAIHDAKLG